MSHALNKERLLHLVGEIFDSSEPLSDLELTEAAEIAAIAMLTHGITGDVHECNTTFMIAACTQVVIGFRRISRQNETERTGDLTALVQSLRGRMS